MGKSTYKINSCGDMVLFQNKIQYVRGLTIGARNDLLEVETTCNNGEVLLTPKPDKNKLDKTTFNNFVKDYEAKISELESKISALNKGE